MKKMKATKRPKKKKSVKKCLYCITYKLETERRINGSGVIWDW